MLNPIVREMYTKDVVDILDRLTIALECNNIECEVYGVRRSSTGLLLPEMIFVDEKKFRNAKGKVDNTVWEILNLMSDDEADEVCVPTSASDKDLWDKYVGDRSIKLWVK